MVPDCTAITAAICLSYSCIVYSVYSSGLVLCNYRSDDLYPSTTERASVANAKS